MKTRRITIGQSLSIAIAISLALWAVIAVLIYQVPSARDHVQGAKQILDDFARNLSNYRPG
jgi:hypothetical protein